MSKKELVKNVIEEMIDQGKDFHEITQGTLVQTKGLENVSKTTIKRAKNEYKKEKIVVKSDYKETLIKRKIYKYLDRHPKTSLSELREALPEIPPNKVSEYHLFWTRKREKAKANRALKRVLINPRKLKEMVFSYLNANENATCENLFLAFPEANRSSITSYFGHWKKKRANQEKGKEGSLYHVIFKFLDNNPDCSLKNLQKSFADVPNRSLEVYLNLWQKKQAELNEVKQVPKSEYKKKSEKKARKSDLSEKPASLNQQTTITRDVSSSSSNRETKILEEQEVVEVPQLTAETEQIRELRKQIEDQKLTMTALEVENSMLKDSIQTQLIEGLETMNADEIKDIKEFIKTYVKGLEAS